MTSNQVDAMSQLPVLITKACVLGLHDGRSIFPSHRSEDDSAILFALYSSARTMLESELHLLRFSDNTFAFRSEKELGLLFVVEFCHGRIPPKLVHVLLSVFVAKFQQEEVFKSDLNRHVLAAMVEAERLPFLVIVDEGEEDEVRSHCICFKGSRWHAKTSPGTAISIPSGNQEAKVLLAHLLKSPRPATRPGVHLHKVHGVNTKLFASKLDLTDFLSKYEHLLVFMLGPFSK